MSIVNLVIFIIAFFVSCADAPEVKTPFTEPTNAPVVKFDVLQCEKSDKCASVCDNLFETQQDLLNKCLKQDSKNIDVLSSTVKNIKTNRWSKITSEGIQLIVKFDAQILIKYADQNKEYSKNLLLWIAETPNITQDIQSKKNLLEDLLTTAFKKLGSAETAKNKLQLGMEQSITKRNTASSSFFEAAALKGNSEAFTEGYNLFTTTCSNQDHVKPCVKTFFCARRRIVLSELQKVIKGVDCD